MSAQTSLASHPKKSLMDRIVNMITLFVFLTGLASLPAIIDWLTHSQPNGFINNPLAEVNGIVWDATFYGNTELQDPAILKGQIRGARNGLRVAWNIQSPDSSVPIDYFSAIFRVEHVFDLATYCFVIQVDDGARLLIDGHEVRDAWWGYTPGATYKNPVRLEQGPHTIEFQYYEEFEDASAHISWYAGAGPECVTTGHNGVD